MPSATRKGREGRGEACEVHVKWNIFFDMDDAEKKLLSYLITSYFAMLMSTQIIYVVTSNLHRTRDMIF